MRLIQQLIELKHNRHNELMLNGKKDRWHIIQALQLASAHIGQPINQEAIRIINLNFYKFIDTKNEDKIKSLSILDFFIDYYSNYINKFNNDYEKFYEENKDLYNEMPRDAIGEVDYL